MERRAKMRQQRVQRVRRVRRMRRVSREQRRGRKCGNSSRSCVGTTPPWFEGEGRVGRVRDAGDSVSAEQSSAAPRPHAVVLEHEHGFEVLATTPRAKSCTYPVCRVFVRSSSTWRTKNDTTPQCLFFLSCSACCISRGRRPHPTPGSSRLSRRRNDTICTRAHISAGWRPTTSACSPRRWSQSSSRRTCWSFSPVSRVAVAFASRTKPSSRPRYLVTLG